MNLKQKPAFLRQELVRMPPEKISNTATERRSEGHLMQNVVPGACPESHTPLVVWLLLGTISGKGRFLAHITRESDGFLGPCAWVGWEWG